MSGLLIGIAGKAGAGKSAVAKRLIERWGLSPLGFADALKAEVLEKFPQTLSVLHEKSMHSDEPTSCSFAERPACIRSMVYDVKPVGVRELLQEYGTNVWREVEPDRWCRAWELMANGSDGPIVAADVRFPNEAATIVARGGLLWRVERDGLTTLDHESERALNGWLRFDAVINNHGGTLEELHARVDRLMSLIDASAGRMDAGAVAGDLR